MTDVEWNESSDPARMLKGFNLSPSSQLMNKFPAPSDRKLRLFACACCRAVWHLLKDERSRRAVEVAERYADGEATQDQLFQAARLALSANFHGNVNGPIAYIVCELNLNLSNLLGDPRRDWGSDSRVTQANLLREIIGNPFQPIIVNEGQHTPTSSCGIVLDRRWLTPAVVSLATAAYSERGRVCKECAGRGTVFICDPNDAFAAGAVKCSACHGTGRIENGQLDDDRLAVLADALEDAGCEDETILAHLRSEGPHVRGCWVLDILLGKS